MKKSFRDAVKIDSLDVPGTGIVTEGLRVRHPTFGLGTVTAVIRWGCDAGHAIEVKFDGPAGAKALAPEYCKLELVKSPEQSSSAAVRARRWLRSLF